MSRDQLVIARARFQDLEEKERLNPGNMLIRLLLINLAPFYRSQVRTALIDIFSRKELEEWTDSNRLYPLFIARQSSVYDLKARLEDEMGLPFEQT